MWTGPLTQKHLVGLFSNLTHEKYCFTPNPADPGFWVWSCPCLRAGRLTQAVALLRNSLNQNCWCQDTWWLMVVVPYQCQLLFGCSVLLQRVWNSMDLPSIAQDNLLWCTVLTVSGSYQWRETEAELRTPLYPASLSSSFTSSTAAALLYSHRVLLTHSLSFPSSVRKDAGDAGSMWKKNSVIFWDRCYFFPCGMRTPGSSHELPRC